MCKKKKKGGAQKLYRKISLVASCISLIYLKKKRFKDSYILLQLQNEIMV